MSKTTTPVGFIRFHGMTLLVVEHEGIEYIRAKALSDAIGLSWRATRSTIQDGDNAVLYGCIRLLPPKLEVLEDTRIPQTDLADGGSDAPATENGPENADQAGEIYMRLDRARMFLARVNTNNLRAKGNIAAAELLLDLQIEWADAIHQYETHGVAVKHARREGRREIHELMKTRGTQPTPGERVALSDMIADAFADQGYPVPKDPQQSLPGV